MKNLTLNERKMIAKMWNNERIRSFRSIGKVLNRHHSTISNEIQSNFDVNGYYDSEKAHLKALERQELKGNKPKIERNEMLKNFIIQKLEKKWSPEQIAGRLKGRFIQEEIGCACHETIYKYIYDKSNRKHRLFEHLRRHRPKRQKWYARKKRDNLQIKERISIHERPKIIDKRERFGDWESDSMIFSKQKEIMSVHVERKFRLIRMHKCANKKAEETYEALVKTIEEFPVNDFHSITFDNGTENVKHVDLKDININLETYFCDAYCSWQKGAVENANMLIRQYLPRQKSLANIGENELYEIQEELNNRPRKSLGFLTPNEAYLIYSKSG